MMDVEIPVVEKIIEKTEVIRETPIVTENVVEVALDEKPEALRDKLETLKGEDRLDKSAVKGLEDLEDFKGLVRKDLNSLSQRPMSSGNVEVYQDGVKIGSSQRLRFSGATVTNDEDGAVKVFINAQPPQPTVEPARVIDTPIDPPNVNLIVGDEQTTWVVNDLFDGWEVVDVMAYCNAVSTSGTPTFQLRNHTQGYDILSTPITIDINERNSYTAAVPAVIDPTKKILTKGDGLHIDVDVAGTGTKGAGVQITIQPA
jgi:hypothetical protein